MREKQKRNDTKKKDTRDKDQDEEVAGVEIPFFFFES